MAAQMGDPGAKHRIGQEAHAAVLDKHRGVAEIGDSRRRYEAGDGIRGTGLLAPAERYRITPVG
jgi:hypothetical protein